MFKRALFAGAALIIGAMSLQGAVTPASAGPNVPKPQIRVVPPDVRIRIPPGTPGGDNDQMPGGDIPIGVIFVPKLPELEVSDTLRELFELTGGNPNDIRDFSDLENLFGLMAMRDLFGGSGGIPDPVLDGSLMSGQRGGTELGGPAQAGGGVPGNPDSVMGGPGWRRSHTMHSRSGVTWHYERRGENGRDTYVVEINYVRGTTTVTVTTSGPDGARSVETTVNRPRGANGRRRFIRTVNNSNGTSRTERGSTTKNVAPSANDEDGNGIPDDIDAEEEAVDQALEEAEAEGRNTGGTAGGGDQGGDYVDPRYRNPRGTIWTPLGGLVIFAVSPADMTSQPPPSDVQGTVMVGGGSSGPRIGPGAVTNPGDGGFIAGDGGGGGGLKMDPCATRDCDEPEDGGAGPVPAGPPPAGG